MSGAKTPPADKVWPLAGNQMLAVEPRESVWLSASAGTGKTQVLSSRVLRLLLREDVEPSQILCLTFTKAGATEMAGRINDKLAGWVRLGDVPLADELKAIGADHGPATRARARTMFASVLDCPGGGLRIDTIHAFSQWLLGAFPHEAGLIPGARPMEDRERAVLARQVLADLLVAAETEPLGDPQLLAALEELSLRMGPDEVEAYLLRCAAAREAWFGRGGWQAGDMRANVLRLLDLPVDADEGALAALCADDVFDGAALRVCLSAYSQWNGKKGQAGRVVIADWLASPPAARLAALDDLWKTLFTQKATVLDVNSLGKFEPDFAEAATRVLTCALAVREMRALLDLAELLVPALRLGRAFALAWDEAKKREGLIDFDDQIREAAALLANSDYAQWIGYKLDRQFDHILVDEAQDTNAAQWSIIWALTQEFFSGSGQRGDALRTLFVVGDYKQAIFRFQGTSPENFEAARLRVREAMQGAVDNARDLRSNDAPRILLELGLGQSFRTAHPVLEFVDRAIAHIGHASFGLDKAPDPHVGQPRSGYVALWRPVGEAREEDEGEPGEDGDEDGGRGGESWLSKPERQMADRIARQVAAWIDPAGEGFALVKGAERRAGPGDIMILVRKRRELAGLIVARLHAAGVPVAGVDRLRLGEPLAVRDLAAALRFAAQPLDDLNLAALLVSPLVGWTQEQVLEHGYRPIGEHLWNHLRRASHPDVAALLDRLGALLARADYDPPQALLHWLLVGPWQGRRRLIARLGHEANDPIDELLNAAHAYAMSSTPSLVGFLHWFDAGKGELKREAGAGGGQVRVMTVHGSKGLQAPIVILADATGKPGGERPPGLAMPDPAHPERRIPLPALAKDQRVGRIAEQQAREDLAEAQEHWRLLYVAMTRAEEALFVGGALRGRDKGVAPAGSWYARLRELFGEDEWVDDPVWGPAARLDWGERPALAAPVKQPAPAPARLPLPEPLPRWLSGPPPEEPRPPRPLAPSSLGEDSSADPPFPPGARADAARRGVLVHKLLECLPDVAPERREEAGARWLARNAAAMAQGERAELLASALAVIGDPAWADLFAPGGLAEVPVAATVGGQVIAGTIDRLVISATRIRLVDFKTARRPPESLEQVPGAILRQMAAYVAALEAAWPGRAVEAALLYTAAPRLIALPAALLAAHKPDLTGAQ